MPFDKVSGESRKAFWSQNKFCKREGTRCTPPFHLNDRKDSEILHTYSFKSCSCHQEKENG